MLSIHEYITKHGKEYTPALFPADLQRGKVGDCFDSALINAAKNRKYKYVEGLARHPLVPDMWVMHAWLTDGINAFDPTWRQALKGVDMPVATEYIGIELDIEKVIAFIAATEYKSVMGNGWRNRELANKLLPDFPYERVQ